MAGTEEQENTGILCSARVTLLAGTNDLGICDSPTVVPIETNGLSDATEVISSGLDREVASVTQIPSDRARNESDGQRLQELLTFSPEKIAVWKFDLRRGL
ncbi:MAG: hypothetical protein AB2693_23600 [Candidatus Thiodiazotropha sp.]